MAAALQTTCTAQQPPPITASITTPTPVTKSGTEIRINVTVANASDHTVKLYKALGSDGQAEAANQVDVYDADGKKLSRIDGPVVQIKGQTRHLPKRWISRTTVLVAPGQSCNDYLILSDLFDLKKPGIYTVTIRHEMRVLDSNSEDQLIDVSSNTITVTVTE
jgi:hypothetical protein